MFFTFLLTILAVAEARDQCGLTDVIFSNDYSIYQQPQTKDGEPLKVTLKMMSSTTLPPALAHCAPPPPNLAHAHYNLFSSSYIR